MAGNERLSYEIAAIYSGSPEIQKAFKDFSDLNAQGQKVVNQLERIGAQARKTGEQIRNSRQGAAQLGMQFNQLATQVGSGTSIFTALSQQLGDVGFAMSFMEGRAGRIGRVLAGPWGAAMITGISLLGLYSKETDKASESQANFGDYAIASIQSVSDKLEQALAPSIQQIAPIIDSVRPYVVKFVGFVGQMIKVTVNATAGFVVGMINMIVPYLSNIGGIAAEAGIGIANFFIRTLNSIGDAIENFINDYSLRAKAFLGIFGVDIPLFTISIPDASEIENSYAGAFAAARKASIKGAEIMSTMDLFDMADIEQRAQALAARRAEKDDKDKKGAKNKAKADKERNKALEEFIKLTDSINKQALPEWKVKLDEVTSAFNELTEAERSSIDNTNRYASAVQNIVGGPMDDAINKYQELIDKANGVDNSFALMREEFVKSIEYAASLGQNVDELREKLALFDQAQANLKIAERNAEIRKSFDSIGQSVSEAFKGMLTAGASWKDGMKGIIQTVIDELWRLFVVQQIVGMVTNFVGAAFGGGGGSAGVGATNVMKGVGSKIGNVLKIGNNANGTPNWGGGLTWVGERGPELVNLPRGSQVIPAHRASQMGGGGVVVNVDARGSADPAAVRAQVQQGILEAAPAIIAAAEQRTVSNMRRPRLGGAMQ